MLPPLNFGVVATDLYRSGHPQPPSFPFLETLNLKTILYIGDHTKSHEYYHWISNKNIQFVHIELSNQLLQEDKVNSILDILLNKDNYPILIHSNKGKHRVGVIVGLVRTVLQGWCLAGAYDEYSKFTKEKGEYDLEFIELFQPALHIDREKLPDFVTIQAI